MLTGGMPESEEDAAARKAREALELEARKLGLHDRHGWQRSEERDPGEKERAIPGICGRCRHSIVYQRAQVSQTVVMCRILSDGSGDSLPRVPADIEWCSEFSPPKRETLTLEEMQKVALVLDVREGPPGRNTYL